MARRIVGTTALFQGDYVGARHHLKQAITAYNPERDRDLVSRFGYDVANRIQAMLAIVLWALEQLRNPRVSSEADLASRRRRGTIRHGVRAFLRGHPVRDPPKI